MEDRRRNEAAITERVRELAQSYCIQVQQVSYSPVSNPLNQETDLTALRSVGLLSGSRRPGVRNAGYARRSGGKISGWSMGHQAISKDAMTNKRIIRTMISAFLLTALPQGGTIRQLTRTTLALPST